jgi:hypothetical protein
MSYSFRSGESSLAPIRRSLLFSVIGLLTLPLLASCTEQSTEPIGVPDFSGYWEHVIAHYLPPEEGPGPVTNMPGLTFAEMNVWVGDYRNPILQPWASDTVKAHDVAELERGEPLWEQWQLCMAFGVPHALLLREPVQFLQEADTVTILYQHDNQIRRIALNTRHPAGIRPSPYGHSVGHYEGDVLVIDTVAMSNTGPIDNYGTPHTDALHVVERYRLTEDGMVLRAEFIVEDQNTFASAWRGVQHYHRADIPGGFRENICAENIRFGVGEEYPVPKDNTPDF